TMRPASPPSPGERTSEEKLAQRAAITTNFGLCLAIATKTAVRKLSQSPSTLGPNKDTPLRGGQWGKLMSNADLNSRDCSNACANSGASAPACESPQMTNSDPPPAALGQRQAVAPAGASPSQVVSLLQAGRDLVAARSWLTDSRAGALNVHRLARSVRSSRPSPTTAAQPAPIAVRAAALGSALPARNGFSTNRHRSWAAMRTPIKMAACSTPLSGRATHMRQKTMTGQCSR